MKDMERDGPGAEKERDRKGWEANLRKKRERHKIQTSDQHEKLKINIGTHRKK